jgi:hypothetical protein
VSRPLSETGETRETRDTRAGASRRLVYGLAVFSLVTLPGTPGLFPVVSHLFGDTDVLSGAALGVLYVVAVPVAWRLTLRRRRAEDAALRPSRLEWVALAWLTLVLLASLAFFACLVYLVTTLDAAKPG